MTALPARAMYNYVPALPVPMQWACLTCPNAVHLPRMPDMSSNVNLPCTCRALLPSQDAGLLHRHLRLGGCLVGP